MKIRVVTWNMAYWSHKQLHDEAWDYLLNTIDADFFLVQESKRPKSLENDNNFLWHNAGATSGRKAWGTGIYSKKYKLTQEPEDSIPSWNKKTFDEMCVVANASIDDGKALILISLYGRMDKVDRVPYCITNLHRVLSDLTGIFNGHFGKRNIVLGGDLNASKQLDPIQRNSSHKIFFDRLEDFGLKNSFDLNGNTDFVQTHRHNISKLNWQNDYLFFSKQIAKGFIDCEVTDNEVVRRLSDHNPVIVTLDI
jgi:exonuclease III